MSEEVLCRVCQKEFAHAGGLHRHLKAHKISLPNYYKRFYPKKDLLTGGEIPFKNRDQYINADFCDYINFKRWVTMHPKEITGPYIINKLKKRVEEKELKFLPGDLYFRLSNLGDYFIYQDIFGDNSNLSQNVGLPLRFTKDLPPKFWDASYDLPILVDTREQKPLAFKNSVSQKLDFGDYTVGGKWYSKTFIDRKSESDFKGTFGAGIDRFKREMDRCSEFNSYMFVLVESSIEKIQANNYKSFNGNKKCNLEYIWHNVKELSATYPNIQIIFCHTRSGVKKLVPLILYHGDELWDVDVDFWVNKKILDKNDC